MSKLVIRILFLMLLVLLQSGCASLSESQCLSADWRQIGEADARAGYAANRVASHNKACEKLGIEVDPATYQSGYAIGLRAFCRPNEAFELGRRGASYHGQCPVEAERDFVIAFELGRDIYALDEAIREVNSRIEELREDAKDTALSEAAREAAARAVGFAKDERERAENRRRDLLYRARERGVSNAW
jgi:hypothetical protein